MLSFLHTADLHLGMRTTRFDEVIANKVREARFAALDNILKKARELNVDFVVIAGDLFDDSTVEARIGRRAYEMLESLPMPVFVLPGNHDPLHAGGVWERPPWKNQGPNRVRLLQESVPVEAVHGAMLLPCPVLRKTSMDDPTTWIGQFPRENGAVRIGVAHGSLKTRADLPPDDHLIALHAASDLKLDYLALGHWHCRNYYQDRDGVERTAYSGVHEPMRFHGSTDAFTGWVPYGGAGRSEFNDGGKGEVLHVRIAGPGAPPLIEAVDVGHFHWLELTRELTSAPDLARLIEEVATRPRVECGLLRLRLAGVLDAESMLQLETLRDILANRYLLGELDESGLHLAPGDALLNEAAGDGVLRRVMDKLQVEAAAEDASVRQVAERAILLLYQIAKE